MSNITDLARNAFRASLKKQAEEFVPPPCPVQFPDLFWQAVEDNMRVAAFDHAAEVVAKTLKTLDTLKVQAALRRAGVKYLPKAEFEIAEGRILQRNSTALLVTESTEGPIATFADRWAKVSFDTLAV